MTRCDAGEFTVDDWRTSSCPAAATTTTTMKRKFLDDSDVAASDAKKVKLMSSIEKTPINGIIFSPMEKCTNIPSFSRAYKDIVWSSFRVNELRAMISQWREPGRDNDIPPVTVRKPGLIATASRLFLRHQSAIRIQTLLRAWTVRKMWSLAAFQKHRPPVFSDAATNDRDFASFEDLVRPSVDTFWFQDVREKWYVCSLESAWNLVCSSYRQIRPATKAEDHLPTRIVNPYTSEPMTFAAEKNMILYCLYSAFCGRMESHPTLQEDIHTLIFCAQMVTHLEKKNIERSNAFRDVLDRQTIRITLEKRRSLPMAERISELFLDIDLLGNYTKAKWFADLDIRSTIRFWMALRSIWVNRVNLAPEIQHQICPIHSPFEDMDLESYIQKTLIEEFLRNRVMPEEDAANIGVFSLENVRMYCLYAMENLVLMSSNLESRRLGAMFVLMALTRVSYATRLAIPWLFDTF